MEDWFTRADDGNHDNNSATYFITISGQSPISSSPCVTVTITNCTELPSHCHLGAIHLPTDHSHAADTRLCPPTPARHGREASRPGPGRQLNRLSWAVSAVLSRTAARCNTVTGKLLLCYKTPSSFSLALVEMMLSFLLLACWDNLVLTQHNFPHLTVVTGVGPAITGIEHVSRSGTGIEKSFYEME